MTDNVVMQKDLDNLRVLQGGLDDALKALKTTVDGIADARKRLKYDFDDNWLHELRSLNVLLAKLAREQMGFGTFAVDENGMAEIRKYQVTLIEIIDFLKKYNGAS